MHSSFADAARLVAHEKEAIKHLNSITMQKNNKRDIMQKNTDHAIQGSGGGRSMIIGGLIITYSYIRVVYY
jgi:hypothetical protein